MQLQTVMEIEQNRQPPPVSIASNPHCSRQPATGEYSQQPPLQQVRSEVMLWPSIVSWWVLAGTCLVLFNVVLSTDTNVTGNDYTTQSLYRSEADLNATDSFRTDCVLPIVAHASVQAVDGQSKTRQNYTTGDRVEIVCESGYRVPHTKSSVVHVVCRADGTWSDVLGTAEAPSCERIGGCPLPIIPNGSVSARPSGFMPEDHAVVQCNAGYDLAPVSLIRCKADGTWEAYGTGWPTCKAADLTGCFPPGHIENGRFSVISPDTYDPKRGVWLAGTRAIYYCNEGYRMSSDNAPMITCSDGAWQRTGGLPSCQLRTVNDHCGPVPSVASAKRYVVNDVTTDESTSNFGRRPYNGTFAHGTTVSYICDDGFTPYGPVTITCSKGEWSGVGPTCKQDSLCRVAPPNVTHADFAVYQTADRSSRALYFCHTGYRLARPNASTLNCSGLTWTGQLPSCVRRKNCDVPMDIENGNWVIQGMYADYRVGVKVHYECNYGYKRIGAAEIECLLSGYWSDYPPKCLVKDEYCSEPAPVQHSFFACKQSQCNSFRVGTELHYFCNSGYASLSVDPIVRTCLAGGIWNENEVPTCLPVESETENFYGAYIGQNTLRIIVSTTCVILGVLIIILFAVALQHRIHNRRSRVARLQDSAPLPDDCPPAASVGSPPMLYAGQGVADDREHDRLALIAFADDVGMWGGGPPAQMPLLPSYAEAVHSSGSGYHLTGHASLGLGHCGRIADVRSTAVRDQTGSDHRRNSIVTNASNNLSAATAGFGSLDTMNNAASDTVSTSVTVDTYDSMMSNPSLTASQRAARGSLESSSTHGSLASEAAPLLEHRSTGGTPVPVWEHRAGDAACASDTLRSQTSRSLHSSDATSRIVELPEDTKED